jgi:hypothetical protein
MNEEYFICKLVPRPNNRVSLVWFNKQVSIILKTVDFWDMDQLFDQYDKLRGA